MKTLDRWIGKRVRLTQTIISQVMIGREFVMKRNDMDRMVPSLVKLVKGEVFTVLSHYEGNLDLLYKPKRMPEKVILHVPPSVLEASVDGYTFS